MARFSQINYSHSLNQAAYDFFLQHPLPQVTVHPYINYSRYLFDPLQRRPVWARNQPHPTEVQSIYSSLHPLLQTHVMKQMKLHKNNPKTHTLTCMPDVATFQTASQLSMHFFLLFCSSSSSSSFAILSEVYFRLLNGLLILIPIPRYFPAIRNFSRLNICPKALPTPRSWSSSCPYTLRQTVENLLDLTGVVYPNNVANPIQSSHSYEGKNVHVFIRIP